MKLKTIWKKLRQVIDDIKFRRLDEEFRKEAKKPLVNSKTNKERQKEIRRYNDELGIDMKTSSKNNRAAM
jgi:FtsZ-binding cell division protein ZapB